jgi:hypothetical protein
MEMFKFGNHYYELLLKERELDNIYIQRNVEALTTGGFLLYWEALKEWPTKRIYDKGEALFQIKLAEPTPLSATSKVATIFCLLLAGIFVSMIILGVEYTRENIIEPLWALFLFLAYIKTSKKAERIISINYI